MQTVFASILPVFAAIIIGFGLRKFDIVPEHLWAGVEDLCFWVFFPALMITTLARADFDNISLGPVAFTLLSMMAIVALITLASWPLLKRLFGTRPGQFSTVYQATTRWHGFIGLAIVLGLFGDKGAGLVAVAFLLMVPVLQVSNIIVLAAFSDHQTPGLGSVAKTVAINPILWGLSIGAALSFSGLELWQPVFSLLDMLGRAALAASLLALGAGLSLKAALNPSPEVLLGIFGKLVLTPLAMVGCGMAFGVSSFAMAVLIVCASVPTAMNGFVLARKMGGDAPLYASTATLQTVLSFAIIPLNIWLAELAGLITV